ncbi:MULTISPECIES: transcription termination factor NusA [Allobacillus]|uniref:Transcription termination/antitermination protein NusA n=1 Tax=Allobacillus halotolerans TaxID=570278 RepID=A0ABS6GPM7_9BACI|nr:MULTISPECIES: transcription termination factor NusA [Allobacillus]MBU6081075.1 transcription termination factor NusA [Allobacillus halotolerans]TSJ69188.1 transcription termination/antitermination protein NusA [Allobacillus sp. SKP2-8]
MKTNLFEAINLLASEKEIDKEILLEALDAAIVSAYKKNFNSKTNVRVEMDEENETMKVYSRKDVVEDVQNEDLEISLEEAKELDVNYEIGDVVEQEVTPRNFGRIAAQNAKQVVTQRVREAERDVIYEGFIDRVDDIMTGKVQRMDARNLYVHLGKIEGKLPLNEIMPTESYKVHDRIKVYVTKVEKTSKGPQVYLSRTHPGLLKRLFEMEVPEIYDGIVEIRSVAREAGDRSKISVFAEDEEIDPVGSCVGQRGQRVQAIVDELQGEKIDIVHWSEDPVVYISNALSPSRVTDVLVNEEENATTVIVPDNQLSLAIGKRGQNARLAAKLTGWKIDIKSESDAEELGLFDMEQATELDHEMDSVDFEEE